MSFWEGESSAEHLGLGQRGQDYRAPESAWPGRDEAAGTDVPFCLGRHQVTGEATHESVCEKEVVNTVLRTACH